MNKRAVQFVSIVILLALMAPVTVVRAETPEQIRQRELRSLVQQLQAKEDKIRGALDATRAEKDTLQNEVNKIRGQINYMESVIQSTGAKIELTDVEIVGSQDNIGETQKLINERQAAVGRLIVVRDQQDQEGLFVNLVRFDRISDFFQRIQEVVTVHSRLVALVSELQGYRVALEMDIGTLEVKKDSLEELSKDQEHQQYGLIVAKSTKDRVLTATKGKESEYQRQVSDIEKQKQAFFKELQELELKIRNGGLFIVHYTATAPPPGTKLFQTPAGWLTQGYGMTTYARRGTYGGSIHNGIDVSNGAGALVRAIGGGQIVANGTNRGWGNWIAVRHANNMVSVYAHMNSFAGLSIGAQVAQNQVIGYEGSTGFSTGAHLHLSLYTDFFTYINDADGKLHFGYAGTVNPRSYM